MAPPKQMGWLKKKNSNYGILEIHGNEGAVRLSRPETTRKVGEHDAQFLTIDGLWFFRVFRVFRS
jgi:hypothetical protein